HCAIVPAIERRPASRVSEQFDDALPARCPTRAVVGQVVEPDLAYARAPAPQLVGAAPPVPRIGGAGRVVLAPASHGGNLLTCSGSRLDLRHPAPGAAGSLPSLRYHCGRRGRQPAPRTRSDRTCKWFAWTSRACWCPRSGSSFRVAPASPGFREPRETSPTTTG